MAKKHHTIVARFSQQLAPIEKRKEELEQADIAIDFSHPHAVIKNLSICLSMGKPIVIGTTDWEKDLPRVKEMVAKANGSCLYAPNFSIGIFLFKQIVSYAASLIEHFDEYDPSAIEYHHSKKVDSPSGTAKHLEKILLEHMPRVTDFHFSSVRSGHYPGTHTLKFDSPEDTIILSHEARNRNGFAKGALLAAEWLLGKHGFFTLEDVNLSHKRF